MKYLEEQRPRKEDIYEYPSCFWPLSDKEKKQKEEWLERKRKGQENYRKYKKFR